MLSRMSRIPDFYKLSVSQRVREVHARGLINETDYLTLVRGDHTLTVKTADKMIENVIGVMGLPVGLGLNFLINDKEYVVPLVVEEPSIVAALSAAAKIVRNGGGFDASSTESILIGQVQVVGVSHMAKARSELERRKQEILNLANSLHPNMVARGGGAKDTEVHTHPSPTGGGDMLVIHLLVDTCDAMGANLVNTMCEGVAALVETITGGKVFLRILSNLTDRALVTTECVIPVEYLAGKGFDGEQVRDGIIVASEFAVVDPYRAATHNKGIMNGVDAVALATGNDWRAIEAAAHAHAARGGHYSSLSRWSKNDRGDLVGWMEIPMKVGTVGGPLQSNPTVALNHRILDAKSARELAEVMGAVGLAQNFAALRALATEGIQHGHMTLHARSVTTAAGAPADIFDTVVERLIDSGDIKIWKANEIIEEVRQLSAAKKVTSQETTRALSAGHGKIILLGEHAVVYGRHAIAAPVPLAIQAQIEDIETGIELMIPRWGVEQSLHPEAKDPQSFDQPLATILEKLDLSDRAMRITVFANVPRAMGLGGSAAVAVAIIRAMDDHFRLNLSDEAVNGLAFECEKVAHGTPSGIDNTMATYGRPLLYRRGQPPLVEPIKPSVPIRLVIGMSGIESLTARMVANVRKAWQRNNRLYEQIFDSIDRLTLEAVKAIHNNDMEHLGDLMNVCQGQLNSLQVSSWEIEEMIQLARRNGALGAKLTGGGGGGSIIALCPENAGDVSIALEGAGYQAMEVVIE